MGKHRTDDTGKPDNYRGQHRADDMHDKTAEIRTDRDENGRLLGFGVGRQTQPDNYTDR